MCYCFAVATTYYSLAENMATLAFTLLTIRLPSDGQLSWKANACMVPNLNSFLDLTVQCGMIVTKVKGFSEGKKDLC